MASGDKEAERALDAYLIASARTGDGKAFALLFKRWNPRLTAHAWRLLGDREAAGDAVQEAWAEIVRGLGCLADLSAFPAWATGSSRAGAPRRSAARCASARPPTRSRRSRRSGGRDLNPTRSACAGRSMRFPAISGRRSPFSISRT